ncbi:MULTISPECIES: ferritin-like domain-containing protein [unclassified Methylobacterium]|uniref:ferritin-like domain-containing protein n=1 Tax=unclassified Methylobacterium TaxID=2615210 RepID=UPI0011C9027B|nr:ferritin-like domain-containing protein [Methylobacterium sp. WL64]TXN00795.1 ferritin-like domain-containing protein [Methylobacterium sp. WL64]
MIEETALKTDHTASAERPRQINLEAGRRAFLGAVGLGVVGAALFSPGSVKPALAQSVTDADIFNFALNLEYLEAEFYLRASVGQGLSDAEVAGAGTVGAVSGGRAVQFQTQAIANYANEIARNERAHVNTLRQALGSNAVARPAIDLNFSFTIAARAAGLAGPNDTFDAFANDTNFLLAAFIFEDVGVTAYNGAAPLIKDPANLAGAASILAVEAYHAGIIRTLLYSRGLYTQAQKISDARDSLDGTSDDDQGIGSAGSSNLSPVDQRGLVFARTPQQVLNIVYLNPNGNRTGFFPNGLNGNLR